MNDNPCFGCECYDEDFGCTMPSIDKSYTCKLYNQPKPIEFFLPMAKVPTKTHQEKQVNWKTHTFYEPAELLEVRSKLTAHLAGHVPQEKFTGPVRLTTKWLFPVCGKHKDGEYKTSSPDTDNMIKTFKDCCTKLGYWKDDAQVASEITEKFWAAQPGIYVKIESLMEGKE